MTVIARRSFLATVGAGLAAPAILRAQSRSKRYPIAFSTLGCPAWSWKQVLDCADRLGYAAIELRGIAGEMDLPKVPELSGTRLAETKKDLAALGVVVSDLGASSRMHEKDPAVREKQLDEGRRFIDLAQALGVKYVRMFGDKIPEGEPKEEVMKRVVEGFQKMAAYAKPAGVFSWPATKEWCASQRRANCGEATRVRMSATSAECVKSPYDSISTVTPAGFA